MKLVLHFDEGEIRERIWRQSICSYTTNISTPEIRMSVGIERFLFFFRRFGAGFGTRTKKKCPPFQSHTRRTKRRASATFHGASPLARDPDVVSSRGEKRDARVRTPAVTPRKRAPEGTGSIARPSRRCPSRASAPTETMRGRTREARRMRAPRNARGQACSPSGGRWTSPGGRSARRAAGAGCTPTAGAPRAAAAAATAPRGRRRAARLGKWTTRARGVPRAPGAFPPARGRELVWARS
jgi:hypothetical protein